MKNLSIIENRKNNEHEVLTINSREVARMTGKEHKHLIRDIRGYVKVLEDSPNLVSQDFFIKSTYVNSQNKTQPCFLLTKKGCDMVANKMTGDKGVIFTATYINRFEELEKQVNGNVIPTGSIKNIISNAVTEEINRLEVEYSNYVRPLSKDKVKLSKYIKNRLGIKKADKDFYLVKERVLILLGAEKWEDVPMKKLKDAMTLIDDSIDVMKRSKAIEQMKWL